MPTIVRKGTFRIDGHLRVIETVAAPASGEDQIAAILS